MTPEKSAIFPHRPLGFLEKWLMQRGLLFLLVVPMIWAVACEQAQPSAHTNRVPAMPTPVAAAVDPPAPAPAPKPKDRPMYGETFFLGTITSVYYYPNGGNQDGTPDNAATHVKFDYRDDDIWLCGDQRPKLTPGERAKMVVTFEPNTECETNWRLK